MSSFIAYTLFGLFSGAAYAIAASGLVLTYSTTRVFNIAHGALGMLLSFVFWDFSVKQGMPTPLALALVLFVVAPAIGWVIARFIARGLGDAQASVSLVVTVALLVLCIGAAQQIYPAESRTVLPFFAGTTFSIGDATITAHQVITILASVLVAVGLFVLLTKTRVGTAMRASVDNPELLRLFGGKPDQVAALAWMIGVALAGLGGILLVSTVGLDYYALTLLVINAYAAAMLGRLKSLPWTFVGAMGLGLLSSYVAGYVQVDGVLSQVKNVVPALFLFVVVVALPQAQLRIGQVKGIVSAPLPSLPRTMGWSAGLLLCVALLAGALSQANLLLVGTAATFSIVMLSLVLLTGYGGHVSLAQLTFAGVGALTYAKLDQPNLGGLLLSALVAAGVGALVALPVLRLTGLYLALATLAFASIMDKMVFQADFAFGFNGLLPASRLSILGHTVSSDGGYVFLMAVFLVLTAWAVLLLRRGVRRPAAHRHPRQHRCLRHPRPRRPLVPRRPVRALGSDSGDGRRAVRRTPPEHRGRRLHLLPEPAAAPVRRGLRGHVDHRRGPGRCRDDGAAGAAVELPVRRRPAVRRGRGRRDPAGPRAQRTGGLHVPGGPLGRAPDRPDDPGQPADLSPAPRAARGVHRRRFGRGRHVRDVEESEGVPAHAH